MGPTGSGKTTFINRAVGNPDADHESTSYTKEVHTVRYPHSDGVRNIVLVDTPGCNDSFMTDIQVLAEITWWLITVYEKSIKLHGILYFHPISDHIIRETAERNYHIFQEMCGKDYCKNVIFVTTMWDQVSEEVGSEREQDLRSDFWRAMIALGSTTRRFNGTTESASNIINSLCVSQMAECRTLQIQREMVDEYLPLQLTSAGKVITNRLLNSVSDLKRLKKGPKRRSRATRITVTLTDDPTTSQSTGTGMLHLNSSGNCSVEGYPNALAHVIRALRAATGGPELVHLDYIRDAIGVCLDIALSIVPMMGTHHAFFQLAEIATLLINMVVEHVKRVKRSRISADIQTAISEFSKEMKDVQEIMEDLARKTPEARRVLRSTDVRIISSCASSMRAVCDTLRSTSSINHDFGSMDDGFEALKRGLDVEICSCGISTEPEQTFSP
ncbi:P-loop containing nucleoside triphosphate hydrolase protein [Pisolithus albus]|nr:P-loop containing nucleoside triphosphate hydrolase protein [Pisolithus albus]